MPPPQTTAPSRCTARATAVIAVLLVGRCKLVRYFTEASFGRLNHLRARGFYAGTKNAGTEFSVCLAFVRHIFPRLGTIHFYLRLHRRRVVALGAGRREWMHCTIMSFGMLGPCRRVGNQRRRCSF